MANDGVDGTPRVRGKVRGPLGVPRAALADIWVVDGTRWAELLLATVKIALAVGILSSFGSPAVLARFGAAWVTVGFVFSLFVLMTGLVQCVGVLYDFLWVRQVALVAGTMVWGFYTMLTLLFGGSLQGILIYVPLITCNILIIKRLANFRTNRDRLRRGHE